MNCCDDFGDCRQGRDCPVRTQGAKVANVGRRIPKHPSTPRREQWRAYLKDLARAMLLVIAVMFVSAATVALMAR